jgi:hypothetical protein
VYNYIVKEPQRVRMGFATGTVLGDWFENVFGPALGALEDAYAAWKDPQMRTQPKNAALQLAQENFIPVFRKFYNGFLKENPLVTSEDLADMDLPKRTSTRTPSPHPSTWPVGRVDLSKPWTVIVHFHDSAGDGKNAAKPAGVHGAEIRWQVFDAPRDVTFDDLSESSFDTHTPFEINFREEERGKYFYYVMRWENTRGEKGSFGLIGNAVIP